MLTMTEILGALVSFANQLGVTPIITGFFALLAAVYFLRKLFGE